jgi:hypothetical protein
MKISRTIFPLLAALLVVTAMGCGDSSEKATLGSAVDEAAADAKDAGQAAVDEAGEAAEEVAAEVEEAAGSAMDSAAEMADQLKSDLAAKEAELAEVTEKIKQLSPQDLLTDKGKKLQGKSESLMAQIEELKAKM